MKTFEKINKQSSLKDVITNKMRSIVCVQNGTIRTIFYTNGDIPYNSSSERPLEKALPSQKRHIGNNVILDNPLGQYFENGIELHHTTKQPL